MRGTTEKCDSSERKESCFSSDSLPPSPHVMPVPAVAGVQGYCLFTFSEGLFLLCPFRSRSISGASSGLSTSPLSSPRVSGSASRSVGPVHSHMLDAFQHLLLQSHGS